MPLLLSSSSLETTVQPARVLWAGWWAVREFDRHEGTNGVLCLQLHNLLHVRLHRLSFVRFPPPLTLSLQLDPARTT